MNNIEGHITTDTFISALEYFRYKHSQALYASTKSTKVKYTRAYLHIWHL